MIVYVCIEYWFDSGFHDNLIITINLWKGKDIGKICETEMNIDWEKMKCCCLCVMLTATFGVESCGTICIPDITNKIRIENFADGTTGIKDYPTEGNEKFWLIEGNLKCLYICPIMAE